MLPGPNYVIKCPNCSALLYKPSLASGNTFGAEEYSDGKFEAPMLPEFPAITICGKCSKAFWIGDAKEVGSFEWYDESVPSEWRNAQQVRFLETEEYFSILGTPLIRNRDDEFYIRERILWEFNDRVRGPWGMGDSDAPLSKDDFEKWQGNILALIRILNQSRLSGYKKLLLAELYRNLGDFEKCEKILSSIKGDKFLWIKHNLLRECKNKNTKVVQLEMDWHNKEIALIALRAGSKLRDVSEELRDDKELVLEAVRNDGLALEFASEELKDDREIVLEAIKKHPETLEYASERLRADVELVLEAVNEKGFSLRYAAKGLWDNREFVLKAFMKVGNHTFHYVSKEARFFWADKELVLLAVKAAGFNLQFAFSELKADREIVMEAVKRHGWTLQFASQELKADREIVMEAEKSGGWPLPLVAEEPVIKEELVMPDIITQAMERNEFSLALSYLKKMKEKNMKHSSFELLRQTLAAENEELIALTFDQATEEMKKDGRIISIALSVDNEGFLKKLNFPEAERKKVMVEEILSILPKFNSFYWKITEGELLWEAATAASFFQVEYMLNVLNRSSCDDLSTALIGACRMGHLGIAKLLVGKGADVTFGNNYAMKYACDGGFVSLRKYLESKM